MELLESKRLSFMLRGVETEYVLRNNEEIFKKYRFHQKAIDAVEASTRTKLLNEELSSSYSPIQ